jgi:hypothetical protein
MRLDQDPGPYNVLGDRMPADPKQRDGSHFWLIHGPTFVFAARCGGVDMARALVLDKLCYSDRAELAENLSARPATLAEVQQVVRMTGRPALRVQRNSGRRLVRLLVALYKDDVRHGGEKLTEHSAFPSHHSASRRRLQNPQGAGRIGDQP